jgi:hypothetical protein
VPIGIAFLTRAAALKKSKLQWRMRITLDSIKTYSMTELADWYRSVPDILNIIRCRFQVETITKQMWQAVADKDVSALTSLRLKRDEQIRLCHKYKERFAPSKMLNLEYDLVTNNIHYTIQRTAGLPIYIITLPSTRETIKYAMSSGKVYKNKAWHTSREVRLYNLLRLQ